MSRHFALTIARGLLGAGLLLAVASPDAYAATFTVDSTVDAVDATLGDGVCATTGGGCTVRAAIQEANHHAGADVVSVPAGTYVLTIPGAGEDQGATGDLDIRTDDYLGDDGGIVLVSGKLELVGAGADLTIIDGNGLDTVVDIVTSMTFQPAEVRALTLRNGLSGLRGKGFGVLVTDCHIVENLGIGVFVGDINSALGMSGCTVSDNTGPGIVAHPFDVTISDTTVSRNGGTGVSVSAAGPGLRLTRMTISDNVATECGGLSVTWGGNTGSGPRLEDVAITGNTATAGHGGGACFLINGPHGMSRLTVADNEASGDGGGIWFAGIVDMNIGGSTITDNVSGGSGGGIRSGSGAKMGGTVIDGNHADVDGGGMSLAGASVLDIKLLLDSSSITNNSAGGDGGGLHAPNGLALRLVNSTIGANSAGGDGGGLFATTGPTPATVSLEHVTFAGNDATGTGGGIYIFHPLPPPLTFGRGVASTEPSFVVNDSIIADNTAADGTDCSTNVIMTSSTHNLVEDTDGCLVPIDAGSVYGADPALAPLANGGGLTLVYPLLSTSPALDAANPTCAAALDQRGVTRPQGPACDIGAYERTPCGNGTVEPGEACDDGNVLDGDCCSSTCIFESSGNACAADTNACTDDVCDGTGACTHPPNTAPCDDGDGCTTGDVCGGGSCTAGAPVTCDACESCNANSGCVAAPRPSCRQQTVRLGSPLQLTDKTTDKLTWAWSKGDATTLAAFGNPLGGDGYALCLFDESGPTPQLAFRAVTRSGQCGQRACWSKSGSAGFRYKDAGRTPDGLDAVLLKSGVAGKAKILVSAKGANLDLPTLPLALPARMQLQAENGECWEARYFELGTSRNDAGQYKGKAFIP